MMIDEWQIRKDLEGNYDVLIKVLFYALHGQTEEHCKRSHLNNSLQHYCYTNLLDANGWLYCYVFSDQVRGLG
jgi:hypothetical protein